MAFAIIISEKGGAERREAFDKGEISVGRVQGNDLMLPKGNVSKRHARLMFRDGRFLVADLKSTNGTYVNGRKISQATLVREGDKIYVGDFVLRFEAVAGAPIAPECLSSAPGPRDATAAELGQPSSVPTPGPGRDGISHYPLEEDPDDLVSASPRVVVPSPPRIPSGMKGPGGTQQLGAMASAAPPPAASPAVSVSAAPLAAAPPTDASSSVASSAREVAATTGTPGGPSRGASAAPAAAAQRPVQPTSRPGANDAPRAAASPPARASGKISQASAAQRLALATLVDRIGELLNLDPTGALALPDAGAARDLERSLREQATALKHDGEIPDTVDLEALCRDAQRELLGLGPLDPLLEDDEVSAIHVNRHDQVLAVRGASTLPVEPPFSSEEALRRVLLRLCQLSGQPLAPGETIVERRLPRGQLLAVLAPAALSGPVVLIRKRRRPEAAAEDLVRNGTLSRAMWTFLSQCLSARLNILVTAPPGPGLSSLLGALVVAAGEERLLALQAPDAPFATPAHCPSFQLEEPRGEALVRAVSRLSADRLVVGGFSGPTAVATLDAIGDRALAVLAALPAPSARQGLARVVPELCAARPGLSPEAAREWLASSFDVAIDLARLRDGRHRVLRVAEISGVEAGSVALRDLFVFAPDRAGPGGAAEGAFSATGTVPRFVDELRLRGINLDTTVFERVSARLAAGALTARRVPRSRPRRGQPSRAQRKPSHG